MFLPVPLRRIGYRVAHRLLRLWWLLARPAVSGVQCILTDDDRILLVRHTYGPDTWDLPGGTMKRGERPEQTARREMAEELGVELDGWRAVGTISGRAHGKLDTLYCFVTDVSGRELTVDRGEIDEVRWFSRDRLPPKLGRYVRRILARASDAER